jgi:hypothetical protein
VLLSPISLKPVKADAVAKVEGNMLLLDGILTGFHRVRGTGHAYIEVIQEPGRPYHFHEGEYREREPGEQTLAHCGRCLRHNGNERAGTLCGLPRTKETKLKEMRERESECPILLMNQGNLPKGTLRREGGTVSWNL